ncbi:hypothetical protein T265_00391 [Opisthorchis viverrini]|uniref:Uncharacterized protein n=1 Tax=Opisthorchis viverrini TaxID=6198 RepID=A0A075AD11_OPIVI|nr:hypothetical protein T265_00391 [Opisthorchis viverrini]KER33960.1 hypothetical protein T265_00391 [Opisthorchis viverrini]
MSLVIGIAYEPRARTLPKKAQSSHSTRLDSSRFHFALPRYDLFPANLSLTGYRGKAQIRVIDVVIALTWQASFAPQPNSTNICLRLSDHINRLQHFVTETPSNQEYLASALISPDSKLAYKTKLTNTHLGWNTEKWIDKCIGNAEHQKAKIPKKLFNRYTLSVPSFHTTRRKYEGWKTARLPKPRQEKSRCRGGFEPRTFRRNNPSVYSCHATRRKHEAWDTARLPKQKLRRGGRVRTTDVSVSKFDL